MNAAASARRHKERHPERYCPHPECLWRTGDGSRCPRHKGITRPPYQGADGFRSIYGGGFRR